VEYSSLTSLPQIRPSSPNTVCRHPQRGEKKREGGEGEKKKKGKEGEERKGDSLFSLYLPLLYKSYTSQCGVMDASREREGKGKKGRKKEKGRKRREQSTSSCNNFLYLGRPGKREKGRGKRKKREEEGPISLFSIYTPKRISSCRKSRRKQK